jgi:hypothetical protein
MLQDVELYWPRCSLVASWSAIEVTSWRLEVWGSTDFRSGSSDETNSSGARIMQVTCINSSRKKVFLDHNELTVGMILVAWYYLFQRLVGYTVVTQDQSLQNMAEVGWGGKLQTLGPAWKKL